MKLKNILALFFSVMFLAVMTAGCGNSPEKNKDLLQTVKERKKLIVGVKFDSKPFGFVDEDQQLKGFDVELVKKIAKRILGDENAVEFKQVTARNRIYLLTSGAIDMVAATMTINEKRKQIIDFSNPYYEAGQTIMVPKNSKINTVKDLNGKKVIVVLGSTSERNLRTLAPKAIIKGFRTYTDAYTALKAKRADALTTDDTIIAGLIYDDPDFKMLKERYTKEYYGIAFRKSEKTQSLKNAVNIALESLQADGKLEIIKRKWMVK